MFRTTIEFDNDRDVEVEQATISATVGYQLTTRVGLSGSVGAIVAGDVDFGATGDVGRGIAGSISINYLPVFETDTRPFVSLSATVGAATARPVGDDDLRHRWTAVDVRIGAMIGKTLWQRIVPFVAARGFGGPVRWTLGGEKVTGSDAHHYSVGGGALYQVPGSFSVFVELLALGEHSASAGASVAF